MMYLKGLQQSRNLAILGAARGAPMIIVKPIKRNPDLAALIEVAGASYVCILQGSGLSIGGHM